MNETKLDIDELRKNTNLQGIKLCDKPLTFFYDETENVCKFYLTETGVNDPTALSKDFVLAGVMYENRPDGIDSLFSKFNLQANELKYKKMSRNKTFEQIICSKRITLILNWLLEKDIYIHFSSLGNLYYALADIIDSIIPNELMSIIFELKSFLHQYCKIHFNEFYPILYKYHFPNIKSEEINNFSKEFIAFLEDYELPKNCNSIYIEIIKQLLKEAARKGNLIFLQDNEDDILVDLYFNLYQNRCINYKYSFHHFDIENEVIQNMEEFQLYENGQRFINYDFLESIDDKFIQLSDVISGLLCDLFQYLDNISFDKIQQLDYSRNKRLIDNISKIQKLIIRSDNFHPMLIHIISDMYIRNDRLNKLALFNNVYNLNNQ